MENFFMAHIEDLSERSRNKGIFTFTNFLNEDEINELMKHRNDLKMETPLLRDVDFPFYWVRKNTKKRLISKLSSHPFEGLREHPEFIKLWERANALEET